MGEGKDDARQEVVQIVKRGAEFTEEVLKENERLRYRVAQLETAQSSVGKDDSLVAELLAKIRRLEHERSEIGRRFAEVEAENQNFANRYIEIENENNNLLNIYVASYQLHSTLDFHEVLQILIEIILNFVGAEVFAIGLVPEGGGPLRPLIVEGMERDELASLATDSGVVGDVVASGEPRFVEFSESREVKLRDPGICVPLKIKGQVIGVVLIYRFLQQKTELAAVDHELFTLLAGHAATAIFASKLYTDSKRKLKTIQGFIDLMTSEGAAG
ncbi:MAG: diguanylate phosphodiesterase [Deltaproteobacteria bacterium RIFOXYA12_FULL_58_15]|nr:MAG: diguanylate phosphodiesterase [Deltaproteobacteria bacterium RIFOXYA12_FULL_58_15]OGR11269.1 MAG: diguanylate phosphodiesterase [Deltaproteobacteria bacterium RIFOXYB12_FULL_58_9]